MKLSLASISSRKVLGKGNPAAALVHDYLTRAARMVLSEALVFPDEIALLDAAERRPGRPAATLILFDSCGALATSDEFATHLGRIRDEGAQRILYAIGPPDGWSPAAFARAAKTFSFGRMTLPHELARAVAAEQIYRALTILAGHPYHSGH